MHCIQWSPTNGALACGGSDGRAHLLKPTGELLGRIPDVSPDDGFDARDATGLGGDQSGVSPPIRALAFSKGSRYLATAGSSTEVTIWDLKRKSKLKSLSGHRDSISAVQYSPGDQHVASAGREGRVVLHSPVSGLVVGEMLTPGVSASGSNGACAVASLHYSPHRRQMLASASSDGAVRVWDTGVRRLTTTLSTLSGQANGAPSAACDARFSPVDTNVVAAACGDGNLVLLDANAPVGSKSSKIGSIHVGASATSVSWRGDGGVCAVGAGDGRVAWIDPRMLSSNNSGHGNSQSVLYTTAAHVRSPVTQLRWQHAVDVHTTSSTALEATTPETMRLSSTRPEDNVIHTPVNSALFSIENTEPNASPNAMDVTPATIDSKEIQSRRAAELEEESRKRVERLLSARGAGTPELAAAAARPTRSGAPTHVPSKLSLGTPGGNGTRGTGTFNVGDSRSYTVGDTSIAPGIDVPGTLALAEAIAETRRATTSAVRDVHVEILRQMHEMREAQNAMFVEMRDAQRELAKEVAALRNAQMEFVRR